MAKYDGIEFNPPAPVAEVQLLVASTGKTELLRLLIDTGADQTLLPRLFIDRLGVAIDTSITFQLVAFDGSTSLTHSVEIDMVFSGKVFRGRYLLTDQTHGILGRDILNNFVLQLDGPSQEWTI